MISTLCDDKFTVDSERFNTKEADYENRIHKVQHNEIPHNEKDIINGITQGILNDNSKALLATYWIQNLQNFHGFSATNIMHILWCIDINYADNADVLKDVFPLTDEGLIKKDQDVLDMAQKLLPESSAPLRAADEHENFEQDLRRLLNDLFTLLNISYLLGLNKEEYDCTLETVSSYFISRYSKSINQENTVEPLSINLFRKQFDLAIQNGFQQEQMIMNNLR